MTHSRNALPLITLLLLSLPWLPAGAASPSIEILTSHPVDQALATGDAWYVHIQYQSDEPLRFQIHASGPGDKHAGAMMNPSPAYPAGKGEAIAWIAFREYFKPDSLTLRVSSHSWKTISEIALDSGVFWSPGADSTPRPEWANRLSTEQQQTVTQDMQTAYSSEGGDWLIFLMAWSVPGYFLLQGWVWLRWHDRWRKAGLLPLWAGIPATAHAVFALLMGSNLWPIVMLFVLPVLTLYLAVVATIRLLKA